MPAPDQPPSDTPQPRPRPHRETRATRHDDASGAQPTGRRVRIGAKSAIGIGVAVFAIAGVASALPGSGASTPKPKQSKSAGAQKPFSIVQGTPASTTPAPLSMPTLHATKQAPATKAVITGLAANGIPRVALNAYRVAAARMASSQPGCGIGWWLLAGIGRVESDHGQFGGATLHPDGISTPKIIGPALTGSGNEYIPAPPNGAALDGDSKYTHALGPMQFIPQTWAIYGTDATGDGQADIFNINDVALSAARYLCAAGGNLRTLSGQTAAILTYNHSTEYLNQVLALANAYRTGVPVSGVPVGNTTGALPPVSQTGPIPPVNPGPPTAVQPTRTKHKTTKHRSGSGGTTGSGGAGSGGGAGGTVGGTGGGGHPAASTSAAPKVPVPAASTTKPVLPLPSITLPLPHPKTTAKKTPTPTPTTCHLNIFGICV